MALKTMALARVAEGDDPSYAKCWYHPEDRPDVAQLLLRYTLNLPGVVAALPPGGPGMYRLALKLAEEGLDPLSAEEKAVLAAALPSYESAGMIFPHPA